MLRARAHVLAAIQGLSAAVAEARAREGGWSVREMVLHLHAWDLEIERVLEPAFRGTVPPWMRYRAGQMSRWNEELLAPLRSLSWDEACGRLRAGRARLLEAIESLPDEPAHLWTTRHVLGRVVRILPHHDLHHAEAIKSLRVGTGTPAPEPSPQPRST
ncbi:MAG TPA: DinB family protein [Terriglobales bacterium]|nr:DinB family protein [Terriglobales bacterium]